MPRFLPPPPGELDERPGACWRGPEESLPSNRLQRTEPRCRRGRAGSKPMASGFSQLGFMHSSRKTLWYSK